MFKKNKPLFNTVSTNPKEGLKLKWNTNDAYTVENLTYIETKTIEDILHLYNQGIRNKSIGCHKMN